MSLFKARDWWSARVGSDEVFDQGSLCVACIDNKHPNHDKVIVGSLNGIVRIYDPKSHHMDDGKGEDMLLEMQLPQPILGLETGQFVSASDGIHLAILHPRKLAVYSLSGSQGAVEHGSHYQLNAMYEHNLQRTSCNMTKGNFGGVKGKDFLCVQSMDGTVSFFEQESFSFSRFLPGFLLPGPIKYMQRTDSFVTISSSWHVESYRYQVLAVATDSANKKESQTVSTGKKINVDWSFNIGEPVLDFFIFNQPQATTSILILGEHSFVCLKENGNLKFVKKLEYNPSCFYPYASLTEGSINTMVGTYTSQLMIYQDTQLKWTAKLDYIPISIQIAKFRELKGAVVSLDEDGHLMCSYLGTDPSIFSVPPPDSREINYAEQDEEMRRLQVAIRGALGRTDLIPAKISENGIAIKAIVPNSVDAANPTSPDTEVKDEDPIPSITVKLSLTSNMSVQNATLLVYAPYPLAASPTTFNIPFIGDSSAPAEVMSSFFMKGNCLPSSLTAKAAATFTLPNGAPRVSHCEFKLPFKLICKACAPFSTALHKITLDTNKSPINLTELFGDMDVESVGGNGNAVGFQVYGGPKTVILASKSSQRYRLQSDVLESMWLMLKELIDRLVIYHKNAGVKGFECSYSGNLPVTEFCQIIDAHLELRINHERFRELLDQRAKQFRAIQRRLLTRFKDKTPAPLNNLDTLLDGTYRQILKLAEGVEENQKAVVRCCMGLSCATLIITTLMKLQYKLSDSEINVLQSALSHHVPMDSEQGWEEVTDAALTNLLRTCLAKTAKDQVVNPVSLVRPSDSMKLKKHLHQVCERLGKGGKLTLPGQEHQADEVSPRKTTGNPSTNGPESNRGFETKSSPAPQVSLPSYNSATQQEPNGPDSQVAAPDKDDVHETPDIGATELNGPFGQLPSVAGGRLGALPTLGGPGIEPLAIRPKKKKKKKKSSHADEGQTGDGTEAIDSLLAL